jgi:hypothetical protein
MTQRKGDKLGDQLWAWLPAGKLAEVDRAREPYLTRNKFVLYALNRAIQEANSGTLRIETEREKITPLSGSVGTKSLNNEMDSPNTASTPTTTTTTSKMIVAEQEEPAGVS